MGVNLGTPGIPPPGPRGRGKGAASAHHHPHLTTSSPPLTAEGAAAMAVAAAGGTLPHGMPYFAYPPVPGMPVPGMPVHHMPMGMPNMGMPMMHTLPWGYPGMHMMPYAMPLPRPVGATPEKAALSANPTLCKPTAKLATPNSWPLRFPFPGIPEHTTVAVPAVTTTIATEEVVAEAEVKPEVTPAVKQEEGADGQPDSQVVPSSSSSVPSAAPMATAAFQPSANVPRVTSSLFTVTTHALMAEDSDGQRSARSSGGSMGAGRSLGSGRSLDEVLDEGIRAIRRSLDEGAREVAVRLHRSSQDGGRRSRGPSIDEGHRSIAIAPG